MMQIPGAEEPKKYQFCVLTNRNGVEDVDMETTTHPSTPQLAPTCAIVSANPLAREMQRTQVQANGNTPRRSARTVFARGETGKVSILVAGNLRCATGLTQSSGFRLACSLTRYGLLVNYDRRGCHTPGAQGASNE